MIALLRYAWQDLRHDWIRTLISVTGLAVLVFSYQILGALSATFADFTRLPSPTRNLVVIDPNAIDHHDAILDPSAMEAARAFGPDWIERVSPLMFRRVLVGDHLVQLCAFPLSDWQTFFQLTLLKGRWPSAADEIVSGEGTARANGWTIGTRVRIYGSDFRISAIFRAPGTMFSSLLMPLDTAERLYGPGSRYQAMIVQTAPRADLEILRTRLQEDPRIKNQYTVFYEDSYSQRNNQASRDITTLTAVAAALALGAITFGTFNATTLSLAEHAREIGCLRAMGFSHLNLRFFIMARALVQGGMAYAFGLAAALLYTFLHASRPISIMGLPLSYWVSPGQAAAGFFWMAILAMAGAWLSSHRLVRTVVADLLREF